MENPDANHQGRQVAIGKTHLSCDVHEKNICLLNEGLISELTDWTVSKCQEQKSTRFLQSFGKDGELLNRKFFSLQTTGLDNLAPW